jgi:hypothetical protein
VSVRGGLEGKSVVSEIVVEEEEEREKEEGDERFFPLSLFFSAFDAYVLIEIE